MANNENIVFDAKSGISVEEQKEILAQINGIAEKNRRQLSEEKNALNARRKGLLFPVVVNIAAVILLAGGALLLVSFNGKVDAQVRTGDAVYNHTEKALIDEIRKDTAARIAAKEMEIASIASRLEDVDAQLNELSSSNESLTADQRAAQERLLALQNSYRDDLSLLQDERSRILEESRTREARLRAQLEERTREFAASAQRASGELDAAMMELERLSSEQEKIAAVDFQLAGGLASVNNLVQEGQYAQASAVIESLRYFCNNNSLASSRSYQTRRDFYNQAINSIETIVDEMQKFQDANSDGWDIFETNAKLEATVADMQKTIDAFSAGGTGQARRLSELEDMVSSLRASVSSLEASTVEKDKNIAAMEAEKREIEHAMSTLQATNSAQAQQITSLNDQLENIRKLLQ